MFLICTAENSVLWHKLCKSVPLNTVTSIKNIDNSKAFNVIEKAISPADIAAHHASNKALQIVLVTTPPALQLASAFGGNETFTAEHIIKNLKATLAAAESRSECHLLSIESFFYGLNSPKLLQDIAPYFSSIPALSFSKEALSIAKLITEVEPKIALLNEKVQSLSSEYSALSNIEASEVNSADALINVMQALNKYSEECRALIDQLTISQIEVAEQVSKNHLKEVSLEQDISVLTSQLFIVQRQIEAGGASISSDRAKNAGALSSKNNALELKNAQLLEKLSRKAQAEKDLRLQVAELRSIKQSSSWKITKKFEKLNAKVSKNVKQRNRLLKDVETLYSSDFFDADWYLTTYKDVKDSGIDPAEHYLAFGAKEGRRPSLEFDSEWYLRHNKDVAESGMNPLLHFLEYGKREKRAPTRFSAF